MKITNIRQAIDKALSLLTLEEYNSAEDAVNICRILIAQVHILELKHFGLTNTQIGARVGVSERTIRAWLNADQCPSLEHAVALEHFYLEVKLEHARKSKS